MCAAGVVEIAITAIVTAVVDVAHPIVAIAVACAADEDGKERGVLVDLAGLANVDVVGPD